MTEKENYTVNTKKVNDLAQAFCDVIPQGTSLDEAIWAGMLFIGNAITQSPYCTVSGPECVSKLHSTIMSMIKEELTHSVSKTCQRYNQEKPANEDLEKAVNDYLCGDKSYVASYEKKGFIAGANWQKEQITKEVVDAECLMLPYPDLFKVLLCHRVTDGLANGDHVKIVIVKDEQSLNSPK